MFPRPFFHHLLFIGIFWMSFSSTFIAPVASSALLGITSTATFTPLPTIVPIKTPQPSPTQTVVTATVKRNANLRTGPGTNYPKVGSVNARKTVRLVRANPTHDWYQLESGEWIAAILVENLSGEFGPVVKRTGVATVQNTPTRVISPAPSTTTDPAQAAACTRPPDDMTRVQINGETVNARTLWMLRLAQQLYGGPGSILRVVQGSYEPGLKESFGTHDGGGAVDISLRNPANLKEVLWDEAPKMVAAMRQAGFAAWYRPTGMFGPSSGAHIHAIAIGDPELSPAARRQLDGPEGYFRGLDGVPPEYNGPHPDPHAGPVLCPWMVESGFKDLR